MRAPWEPMHTPRIAYGGGGGSGGQSQMLSNSTSTAAPSPEIQGMLKNLTNDAWQWMGRNMDAPEYFPGGTVAPQGAHTVSGITGLFDRGANGPGYGLTGTSKQQLADTIGGKYLDPNSNPAYRGWLEASFRPQAEQFRDIIAPSIDSKFAGAGRTAGGAHFDTTMRGVQDLERAQADAAAKAGLGLYQGERANQFSAMGMLPSFQGMDYQDINAMLQAGGMEDAYAQRLKDDQNRKYMYEKTGQMDWYNRMAQTLLGMYPGGQTSSSGSSYGYAPSQGGGGVGSFLGPAMQGVGMALPFIPGFGLSDERAKDVHSRVGFTDDGLPLYLYRYKGATEPRIGPMAQDVEKVKPEAVMEHPSGLKMVDYGALVPEGGLL